MNKNKSLYCKLLNKIKLSRGMARVFVVMAAIVSFYIIHTQSVSIHEAYKYRKKSLEYITITAVLPHGIQKLKDSQKIIIPEKRLPIAYGIAAYFCLMSVEDIFIPIDKYDYANSNLPYNEAKEILKKEEYKSCVDTRINTINYQIIGNIISCIVILIFGIIGLYLTLLFLGLVARWISEGFKSDMRKTILAFISIPIIIIGIALIYLFSIYWVEVRSILQVYWIKEIIISATGGLIGGFIVYKYVIHTEDKRYEHEKKEKCTKSLLSIQMATMIQLEGTQGLRTIVDNILNFSISKKTLREYLVNFPSVSQRAIVLRDLITNKLCSIEDLIPLTNYLLIDPVASNTIALPYEIFEIPTISFEDKVSVAELAIYLQEVVSCNRKYAAIVSLVMHTNKIRDSVINQTNSTAWISSHENMENEKPHEYLILIAGIFTYALDLEKLIPSYLNQADNTFSKTAHYIELLGISPPILAAKDEDGEIIFENKT